MDASEPVSDAAPASAQSPLTEPPRATDESFLRTWLFDRDEPCPLCGYNLRGLALPRCPECWQPLRLSVSLAEPYLKAWIAVIVGTLLPAGFGIFFIIGFLYVLSQEGTRIFRGMFNHIEAGPCFLLLHAVACVPAALAALVLRKRFLALPRGTQQFLAAIVWTAMVISVLIFAANITHF